MLSVFLTDKSQSEDSLNKELRNLKTVSEIILEKGPTRLLQLIHLKIYCVIKSMKKERLRKCQQYITLKSGRNFKRNGSSKITGNPIHLRQLDTHQWRINIPK